MGSYYWRSRFGQSLANSVQRFILVHIMVMFREILMVLFIFLRIRIMMVFILQMSG